MILWPKSAVHLPRLNTASVAGQLAHCHQLESHFLQLMNPADVLNTVLTEIIQIPMSPGNQKAQLHVVADCILGYMQ